MAHNIEIRNGRASRPKPFTIKRLRRYDLGFWKLWRALDKEAAADPAVKTIAEEIRKCSAKLNALASQRELAEAERADKGIVCWEVFFPREGRTIFDKSPKIKRTPNRIWEDQYYTIKPEWRLASGDPWEHLRRLLDSKPFDPVKFEEHARYVDASWRKFVSEGAYEGLREREAVREARWKEGA